MKSCAIMDSGGKCYSKKIWNAFIAQAARTSIASPAGPFPISAFSFVEVGTPVARRPPHRSRRAVFPHRALRAGTSSSLTGRFARLIRHSYGTGCLCGLRQHVGPFSSFGAAPCHWILRADPTPGAPGGASCRCAALPAWLSQLVRQGLSGPPRFHASASARATLLDPGKPSSPSPFPGVSMLGSGMLTPSPLASAAFEAVLLKQDATPACGSRFSRDTLLDGRSSWKSRRPSSSPSAKQSSVLGSWLNFSIHHFHSELRKPGFQT